MTFVPFDASDEEAAAWAVLRPGVPKTMRPEIVTWLWRGLQDGGYVDPDRLRASANALDIDLQLQEEFSSLLNETEFRTLMKRISDRDLLRLADFRLHEDAHGVAHTRLSKTLADARSKYHVVQRDGRRRLATRVPEGVQDAGESIGNDSSAAGQLLQRAWQHVYDLDPQDSPAYFYAVRAVEAAALEALGITADTATLGHAIRAIEKSDSRWRLPFLREHSQYPSKDLLLGMLRSLYRGQRDRHGSEAYSDVTHDEAEGAVLLAVTLVGWFSRGLVTERDTETFG